MPYNRVKKHLIEVHNTDLKTCVRFYLSWKYNQNEEITINYIDQILFDYGNKAIPDIQREFGYSYHDICFLLESFDIKIKSISEIKKSNYQLAKFKQTCQDKYGVDNVSQLDNVKEAKVNTFRKNYGVDNIFQHVDFLKNITQILLDKYGVKRVCNGPLNSEIRNNFSEEKWNDIKNKQSNTLANRTIEEWDDIKNKCRNTMAQKTPEEWNEIKSKTRDTLSRRTPEQRGESRHKQYESRIKWWNSLSEEEKYKCFENRYKPSGIELRIQSVLNSWYVAYERQYWYKQRSYDFRVGNIIIEANGDYWHASPLKYKPDDLIHYPNKVKLKASDVWEKDKIKKEAIEKSGTFEVIYIWEYEMNGLTEIELEELILMKLQGAKNECQDKINKENEVRQQTI